MNKREKTVSKDRMLPDAAASTTPKNGGLITIIPENDKSEKKMQEYTFDNDDKFGRKDFAIQLNRMIQDSDSLKENESFSIAIDASWGMGKTQFIHMWINMLKNGKKRWNTVYYNAWRHDDYDDALAALVCNICRGFQEKSHNDQKIFGITKKILKFSFSTLVRIACTVTPGLEQFTSLGKELADGISEKQACDFFNTYAQRENAKNEFRAALKELIGTEGKLIIFVDELDRCRPSFAIETLEIIKHFFNIDELVFIFALDILQLSKSIETIYGQDMDACGYLSRFFDMQVNLPVPPLTEYVKHTFSTSIHSNYVITFISKLISEFGISVREINILARTWNYILITRQSYECWVEGLCFFLLLLTLKYKRKEQFQEIIIGRRPSVGESGIQDNDVRDYYRIASSISAYRAKEIDNFYNNRITFNELAGEDKQLPQKIAQHLESDSILNIVDNSILGGKLHERIELMYPKQLGSSSSSA